MWIPSFKFKTDRTKYNALIDKRHLSGISFFFNLNKKRIFCKRSLWLFAFQYVFYILKCFNTKLIYSCIKSRMVYSEWETILIKSKTTMVSFPFLWQHQIAQSVCALWSMLHFVLHGTQIPKLWVQKYLKLILKLSGCVLVYCRCYILLEFRHGLKE